MANILTAGQLNRRIAIQAQAPTQDSAGQESQAWSNQRTCWAAIRTASSKEVYAAAGFVSQLSHVITIRYATASPISAGMRVVYAGRYFHVQAVVDIEEAHVVLQLLCSEVSGA